jgi:NAD(P)-dependent dehydrogenase (short-subunit alcohol dehydrogenase family)
MAKQFDGKVAFITGAARGQGRSHAVRFAEEGADIIAVDVCAQIDSVAYPLAAPDDLEERVNLVEKTGRRIVAEQADVRDFASLKAVVQKGVSELGRIDFVLPKRRYLAHHRHAGPTDFSVHRRGGGDANRRLLHN